MTLTEIEQEVVSLIEDYKGLPHSGPLSEPLSEFNIQPDDWMTRHELAYLFADHFRTGPVDPDDAESWMTTSDIANYMEAQMS